MTFNTHKLVWNTTSNGKRQCQKVRILLKNKSKLWNLTLFFSFFFQWNVVVESFKIGVHFAHYLATTKGMIGTAAATAAIPHYATVFAIIAFLAALDDYNNEQSDKNYERLLEKGVNLTVHIAASALLPPPFISLFNICLVIFKDGFKKAAKNDADARFNTEDFEMKKKKIITSGSEKIEKTNGIPNINEKKPK